MDKIYCSNCNAEVTQHMESCPACGASLKPTVAVPTTYTLPDYSAETKQPEKTKSPELAM